MATRVIRNALLRLLSERGWTDVELAARTGIGRPHVNELKNGRAMPRVGTALRIAAALELPVAAVFPPGSSDARRRRTRAPVAPGRGRR